MVTWVNSRVALVAPASGVLLKNHWNAGGGAAVASTTHSTSTPRTTVWLVGASVMVGASTLTVNVTGALVTAPNGLATMTAYWPASLVVKLARTSVAALAPARLAPLNCHR